MSGHTYTHTQDNCSNPRCACKPRVNKGTQTAGGSKLLHGCTHMDTLFTSSWSLVQGNMLVCNQLVPIYLFSSPDYTLNYGTVQKIVVSLGGDRSAEMHLRLGMCLAPHSHACLHLCPQLMLGMVDQNW